jgi:hypothetical protein
MKCPSVWSYYLRMSKTTSSGSNFVRADRSPVRKYERKREQLHEALRPSRNSRNAGRLGYPRVSRAVQVKSKFQVQWRS